MRGYDFGEGKNEILIGEYEIGKGESRALIGEFEIGKGESRVLIGEFEIGKGESRVLIGEFEIGKGESRVLIEEFEILQVRMLIFSLLLRFLSFRMNFEVKNSSFHYWLRRINTRGEVGPWSETISVTIIP